MWRRKLRSFKYWRHKRQNAVGQDSEWKVCEGLNGAETPPLIWVSTQRSQLLSSFYSQRLNTADMKPLFISVLLAALCLGRNTTLCLWYQHNTDLTHTDGVTAVLQKAEHNKTMCCNQKETWLRLKEKQRHLAVDTSAAQQVHHLYWYKQEGTNSPTFILSRFQLGGGNKADDFRERFTSTLDSTLKSIPLKIQKLQPSDSAVYYCALQPTVTGNYTTLYKNLWSKDNTPHPPLEGVTHC